jgi:hypothetical protein
MSGEWLSMRWQHSRLSMRFSINLHATTTRPTAHKRSRALFGDLRCGASSKLKHATRIPMPIHLIQKHSPTKRRSTNAKQRKGPRNPRNRKNKLSFLTFQQKIGGFYFTILQRLDLSLSLSFSLLLCAFWAYSLQAPLQVLFSCPFSSGNHEQRCV